MDDAGASEPLGLALLASRKRSAGLARLDAIPGQHPQQARISMSNHDQTKVRRTQAGRGHPGRDRLRISRAACCGQYTRRRGRHAPSLCRNCHGLSLVFAKSGTALCQSPAISRDVP
jgi:hypothetical protein